MRKLLGAVLVSLLIPAALAAQKPVTPGEQTGRKVPVFRVSSAAATNAALARVRTDLAAGRLSAWGDPHVMPATSVTAARTVSVANGGKDGGPIYLVFVTAPNARGQVRVAVNATTGAIVNVLHRDWGNVATPDWWVTRLEEDPIGTTAPRR